MAILCWWRQRLGRSIALWSLASLSTIADVFCRSHCCPFCSCSFHTESTQNGSYFTPFTSCHCISTSSGLYSVSCSRTVDVHDYRSTASAIVLSEPSCLVTSLVVWSLCLWVLIDSWCPFGLTFNFLFYFVRSLRGLLGAFAWLLSCQIYYWSALSLTVCRFFLFASFVSGFLDVRSSLWPLKSVI